MLVTWVNGVETNALPISDRGFQYGDGVWETLAIRGGQVKQLLPHLQRLKKGLHTLGITTVDYTLLKTEVLALASKKQVGIIKIIISRGSGGRGFYYDQTIQPRRIISLHEMPDYPSSYYQQGIHLTACATRLPHNPKLAGFKRLGCIEQVLARAEFQRDYQEGLIRDYDDHIIEGTMSNLYLITEKDTIITPDLRMCGVAGIARSCILNELNAMGVDVKITHIIESDLQNAKGLFMSNSIIKLWPVKEYHGNAASKRYSIPPLFRALERKLNPIL